MSLSLGRQGRLGRRVELISRSSERSLRRGIVRCASASSGRWVRTEGERSGVIQLSGIALGARRLHRGRWESGARSFSSEGIDLQRRAEAGLMEVGQERSLSPAIGLWCGKRTESGGRHDSADRIGLGVDLKQLVTHVCT